MRAVARRLFGILLTMFLGAALQVQRASAQDVISVPAEFSVQKLVSEVMILEDLDQSLSVEEVASGRHDVRFRRPAADPNYGFTKSAFWVRMRLQQAPEVSGKLMLEVALSTLDHVELYLPTPGAPGRFLIRRSGDSHPFSTRDIAYRNVVFHIPPSGSAPSTLYLRIASGNAVTFPMTLWSATAFEKAIQVELLLYGGFFGTLVSLALYNLFLFFTIRDRAYLFYVGFTTSVGMMMFAYSGLGFQYVWSSAFNNWAVQLFACVATANLALFARAFMVSEEQAPRLNRALLWIAICNIGIFVLSTSAGYSLASRIVFADAFLTIFIVALVCFVQWRRKFKPARFFMLAFGIEFAAGATLLLNAFGIIPVNFVSLYGVQIGSAIDAVLLSLALADRINLLKHEKELAQADAIRSHQLSLEVARQAERELESRVETRTAELHETLAQLQDAQSRLVTSARNAGMAQIAINVLHNVGNVLNSVNTSADLINKAIRHSKTSGLSKATRLLNEHRADLADFLTLDEKGKMLPDYLDKLARVLEEEQQNLSGELEELTKSVDHVKKIVLSQQSYVGVASVVEMVQIEELLDDALRMNIEAFERHRVTVKKKYSKVPSIPLDKHQFLMIIINLIKNGIQAMSNMTDRPHKITLCAEIDEGKLRIQVKDEGEGILPENLTRIFAHGFSTRKEQGGHGFGLHSCALAAKEMGGTLSAYSDGLGKGAIFTLEIPVKAIESGKSLLSDR